MNGSIGTNYSRTADIHWDVWSPYISAIFLPMGARPGKRMLGREVWYILASCSLPSVAQCSVDYKGQGKDKQLGTSKCQLHGPFTRCSAYSETQGAVVPCTSSAFTLGPSLIYLHRPGKVLQARLQGQARRAGSRTQDFWLLGHCPHGPVTGQQDENATDAPGKAGTATRHLPGHVSAVALTGRQVCH